MYEQPCSRCNEFYLVKTNGGIRLHQWTIALRVEDASESAVGGALDLGDRGGRGPAESPLPPH
ncbi:unnamed protein product, partial [Phaeothamnion confervicola]